MAPGFSAHRGAALKGHFLGPGQCTQELKMPDGGLETADSSINRRYLELRSSTELANFGKGPCSHILNCSAYWLPLQLLCQPWHLGSALLATPLHSVPRRAERVPEPRSATCYAKQGEIQSWQLLQVELCHQFHE